MSGSLVSGYNDWDLSRHEDEGEAGKAKDAGRSPFEVDKARILHSSAFRRLQGKTQVLGAGERDFYRTRLTHSLEVAQLAQGLCRESECEFDFEPNRDLVEAICLAHDIGHPPFGHVGEDHLHSLMSEHGGFGANAQNLRIVTFLESKRPAGGLNLTRATLDGLIKYSALFDDTFKQKKPKFVYAQDKDLRDWVKQGRQEPSVECQIATWADDVANSVDDVEDNMRAGLFDWKMVGKRATEIAAACDRAWSEAEIEAYGEQQYERLVLKPKTERERKVALKTWTSETMTELMKGCKILLRSDKEESSRYKYKFEVPEASSKKSKVLKAAAAVLVFRDPRVMSLEFKGVKILTELFAAFGKKTDVLPLDFQELIAERRYEKERLIADFLSGMTDRYCSSYYSRLFQPGEGSFYEHV